VEAASALTMNQALVDSPARDSRATDPREPLRRAFITAAESLYGFLLVRCGGRRDRADELLQETCHQAARHKRPPRCESECERWLFGIARNLIRGEARRLRRASAHVAIGDPAVAARLAAVMESQPLPPEVLAREEIKQQLLLALTSLPAVEQQLLFDVYFEGRSRIDIAESLGVSVKSVEARLYRARRRLRDRLRHWERE